MKREAQALIRILKEKGLTLALAESMTCGLAAHKLSGCIGTSDVLRGSVVCYSPEVKTGLLGVSSKLIKTYTCESKQVTEALVKHLPGLVPADIHAAVTGLASPGGSETKEKPVGTVFFSCAYRKKIFHHRQLFYGSPLEIRTKACTALYQFILSELRLR